jgi:hypothetical protein
MNYPNWYCSGKIGGDLPYVHARAFTACELMVNCRPTRDSYVSFVVFSPVLCLLIVKGAPLHFLWKDNYFEGFSGFQ